MNDIGHCRFAKIEDLKYIVDLSKKESFSLGFIPKIAYEAAITGIKTGKRWSDICNDKLIVIECNGDLVGFCLASFGQIKSAVRTGKIAQICLQIDARLMARGKLLLDYVIKYGESLYVTRWSCGCADDLESNLFWQTMGFIKVKTRMGISHKNTWKETSTRVINIYLYDPYDMFKFNFIENEHRTCE